jgi:hypothetical protein
MSATTILAIFLNRMLNRPTNLEMPIYQFQLRGRR